MTGHRELLTETTGVGFRGRCRCGWAGPDRGYDPEPAMADAAQHVTIARTLTDVHIRALRWIADGRRMAMYPAAEDALVRRGLISYDHPGFTAEGEAAYRAITTPEWTCHRCAEGIWLTLDGEPHDDPETDEAVHEWCCASCHPDLAERWGFDLDATTDDLRTLAEATATHRSARHDDEPGAPLMIAGHGGGMTHDHAARAERGGA